METLLKIAREVLVLTSVAVATQLARRAIKALLAKLNPEEKTDEKASANEPEKIKKAVHQDSRQNSTIQPPTPQPDAGWYQDVNTCHAINLLRATEQGNQTKVENTESCSTSGKGIPPKW